MIDGLYSKQKCLYLKRNFKTQDKSFLDVLIKKRMVQECASDSPNNTSEVLNSVFFLLLDWLPFQG